MSGTMEEEGHNGKRTDVKPPRGHPLALSQALLPPCAMSGLGLSLDVWPLLSSLGRGTLNPVPTKQWGRGGHLATPAALPSHASPSLGVLGGQGLDSLICIVTLVLGPAFVEQTLFSS